jgi:hypothetical protein
VTRTAVVWNNWINARNNKRAVFSRWSAPWPLLRLLNSREAVFSVRSVPRGYKKDKKGRLSQLSFETPACQDMSLGCRGDELRRQNYWVQFSGDESLVVCAIVPRCLECVIQWDCYSFCVKIRYQGTTSGDCNRLRTLVFAVVKCKVRRLAVAIYYL